MVGGSHPLPNKSYVSVSYILLQATNVFLTCLVIVRCPVKMDITVALRSSTHRHGRQSGLDHSTEWEPTVVETYFLSFLFGRVHNWNHFHSH